MSQHRHRKRTPPAAMVATTVAEAIRFLQTKDPKAGVCFLPTPAHPSSDTVPITMFGEGVTNSDEPLVFFFGGDQDEHPGQTLTEVLNNLERRK